MARATIFYLNDENITMDFGTYALLMYYAKQVNENKAKKLFDATISEAVYRRIYDLPDGGLDPFDDHEVHWVPTELEEAIIFIENELIPALNLENNDLFVKYGGKHNFWNLFHINSGFLDALGLGRDEFYYDDIIAMTSYSTRIKEVIQLSLTLGQPYEVYVK